MDSGASGYHICSLMVNNDRMRGIYHEQRDFYQASPAASVQSCQKYPGRNERSGHCLTSLET